MAPAETTRSAPGARALGRAVAVLGTCEEALTRFRLLARRMILILALSLMLAAAAASCSSRSSSSATSLRACRRRPRQRLLLPPLRRSPRSRRTGRLFFNGTAAIAAGYTAFGKGSSCG
jgi:hypothetical protein